MMKAKVHKEPAMASIVIPCYNDGGYIRDAVFSARRQTYSSIEIVIVDDGSEDEETRAILQRLENEGICVVHNVHRGVAHARNTGIRCAKGQYILPLDADDTIEPEYLSEAIAVLEEDTSVGMVYCEADFFEGRGGRWELAQFSIEEMLLHNLIFNAAVFRKATWEKCGGYDETMQTALEDWDFWLGILEQGLRPVRLPSIYFHYRIRAQQSSYSHKMVTTKDALLIFQRIARKHRGLYADNLEIFVPFAMLEYQKAFSEKVKTSAPTIRLDAGNRWVRYSRKLDWEMVAEKCGITFDFLHVWTENGARLALGAVMIQEIAGFSDEETMESLAENPYMRYFCGLSFSGRERAMPVETYQAIKRAMTGSLLQEILQACVRECTET